MSKSPKSRKKSLADHAAHQLLGSAGLSVLGLLIVGALALSITLASPALRSGQLAAVLSAKLVDLTNNDRESDQLGTLTINPVLVAAAQAKADDMAKNEYFAHTSPAGLDSWHWFKQAGYSFSYAGENLAVDFTDSNDVNDAWLNSPTHRANILNGHFTEIGIATAKGTYQGHSTTFVVQMFGTPAKAAPIASASVPTNPTEPAMARTEAADTQVLGTSVAPAKQQVPKVAQVKKEVVAGDTTVQPAIPAEIAPAPTHYAPFWAGLVSSPRSLLRMVYILFALMLAVALIIRTRFELKHHHVKHVFAVLALLVLMTGLFMVADRFVFVAPVVGTGQSI